jgi:tetratricopeptide (TPR) repeat protein
VFGIAIILSLSCASIYLIQAQERTRDEMLKEAGRIATQAERLQGEAHKKVQAGGDRKLITEAQRATAETFEKAIELWRTAGDDGRLSAGVDELTRLYSVLGDYDRVVDRLTREAEFWRVRGDETRQIQTLYLLGIRQMQMQRDAAALKTLKDVVDMSRSARLDSLEANALTQLAHLYDKEQRTMGAEALRARAKELWANMKPTTPVARTPAPATIPAQWVDLPNAPLAAEYRVVNGINQAVLVNRSTKAVSGVSFGCVGLENNKKTRILYSLMGIARTHGGVGPGLYWEPFVVLNGPLNRWTDEKMSCEGAAKMTLIEATFDDGTIWKAENSDWVVR